MFFFAHAKGGDQKKLATHDHRQTPLLLVKIDSSLIGTMETAILSGSVILNILIFFYVFALYLIHGSCSESFTTMFFLKLQIYVFQLDIIPYKFIALSHYLRRPKAEYGKVKHIFKDFIHSFGENALKKPGIVLTVNFLK